MTYGARQSVQMTRCISAHKIAQHADQWNEEFSLEQKLTFGKSGIW